MFRRASTLSYVNAQDLWTSLLADQVPEDELQSVLNMHFGGSRQVDENHIEFCRRSEEGEEYVALVLTYKGETLVGVDAGPALTSDDIAELSTNVREASLGQESEVARSWLFSSLRVEGSWRFQDRLQILPPPQNAPSIPYAMGMHPFVLEVAVRKSEDPLIRPVRWRRAQREAGLVLGVLLHGNLRLPVEVSTKHWMLVPEGSQEAPGPVAPRYLQEGFMADGFLLAAPSFAWTEDMPAIPEAEDVRYYSVAGMEAGRRMVLPESLAVLLTAYYGLPDMPRQAFLRSCYWFHHSHAVYLVSSSASYLALISAIESLIPHEQGPPCPNPDCKKPLGKGPTARFREFLEAFAPGLATKHERDRLYSLRSQLVHGGHLMRRDVEGGWEGLRPDATAELMNADRAIMVARIALISWLVREASSAGNGDG